MLAKPFKHPMCIACLHLTKSALTSMWLKPWSRTLRPLFPLTACSLVASNHFWCSKEHKKGQVSERDAVTKGLCLTLHYLWVSNTALIHKMKRKRNSKTELTKVLKVKSTGNHFAGLKIHLLFLEPKHIFFLNADKEK